MAVAYRWLVDDHDHGCDWNNSLKQVIVSSLPVVELIPVLIAQLVSVVPIAAVWVSANWGLRSESLLMLLVKLTHELGIKHLLADLALGKSGEEVHNCGKH